MVQNPKPEGPVSLKTNTAPDPVVRAQKMREEATEKEVDGHFTTIRPVIPMKQVPVYQGRVVTTDRHGHQHGVHAADRVQRC
jgi:hypothetical protein